MRNIDDVYDLSCVFRLLYTLNTGKTIVNAVRIEIHIQSIRVTVHYTLDAFSEVVFFLSTKSSPNLAFRSSLNTTVDPESPNTEILFEIDGHTAPEE